MALNKDLYCEIVKHVDDLSDMRRLGLANKTLNSICQQALLPYPMLKSLATFFSNGSSEYHETALHILKYGQQDSEVKSCQLRDEDDYMLKLKTLIDQQLVNKQLYFDLPLPKLIKYIISLWFIHPHLFIRLPPPHVLKQYLEETQIFGNKYVALFKSDTLPKDPPWFCGTHVTQTDHIFCFNIHDEKEFLCGKWDGEWPPHFMICDECRLKQYDIDYPNPKSLCGKCKYYYIDFSEDDENDDEEYFYNRFRQRRLKEGISTSESGYYVGDFDAAFRLFYFGDQGD